MANVIVLGASPKPERYAFMAQQMLMDHGHQPIPVSPKGGEILGVPVLGSLSEVDGPVDALTLYVGPGRQAELIQPIIDAKPGVVIINPGAENPDLTDALDAAGIRHVEACSLVLLSTGQFDAVVTGE